MVGPDDALPDIPGGDGLPPKVPPGRYQFVFVEYQTAILFGAARKVIMWFRLVTQGEHFGAMLARYYHVQRLIGKPGRNGKFKASLSGDFMREFYTLFPEKVRLDRIPMSRFKTALIEGDVETVTQGRGRDIPEALQYSRIARLVKVVK